MPGVQGAAASATGCRVSPRQSEPGEASATWTPSLARNPALPALQTEPTEFVEPVAPSPSVPIVGLSDSALPETRLSRRPIAAPRRKPGLLMQWSLFGMAVVVLAAFGAGTVGYLFGNDGQSAALAAVIRSPAAPAASRPALPFQPPVVAVGAREELEPPARSRTDAPNPPRAATNVAPSSAKERAPANSSEVERASAEPKAEKRRTPTRRRPRSALSVAATADMGTVEIRIRSKDGAFRRNSEFSVLTSIGRLPIGRYTVSWRRAGSSAWNSSGFVLETRCDLRLVIKPSGLEPKYLGTCG